MNRRTFLTSAIAAAATLAVDPERLLWTKKKTIFIPKFYTADLAFHKDAFDPDKWTIKSVYISWDEGAYGSAAVLFEEESGLLCAIDEVHAGPGEPLIFPARWPMQDTQRVTLHSTMTKDEFRRRYPNSKLRA